MYTDIDVCLCVVHVCGPQGLEDGLRDKEKALKDMSNQLQQLTKELDGERSLGNRRDKTIQGLVTVVHKKEKEVGLLFVVVGCLALAVLYHSGHRLVGLVVKASTSRAEDPGFESHLRWDFSWSSRTSDSKIGTPVATLPGAWRYRVSAGTGRRGVSIL